MVVQHLANYQFQWVEDKVTFATCLQKLPRSARTVILVYDNQQFPVAHQLKQLGITVFPHHALAYEQYIFTYALSCFKQGFYQVLVTTPATHSPKLFKGIATHVIMDCIMPTEQFWEYLTVMGPEGGTVTTCLSHAQYEKVNMDIYDAVRHQQAQSMSQTSSQPGPIGQEPDRSQSMASVRQISIPGWSPSSHSRCSPSSTCQVPHLAQVCNTHSQLSSGQATGLAHADIGNPVTVSPINTSPGIHKTSGDSGSPIGIPWVLGKAPCLPQTSISFPLQLSPSKAPGIADGINSLAVCHPCVTGVWDNMLIPDPNLYSVVPHRPIGMRLRSSFSMSNMRSPVYQRL